MDYKCGACGCVIPQERDVRTIDFSCANVPCKMDKDERVSVEWTLCGDCFKEMSGAFSEVLIAIQQRKEN